MLSACCVVQYAWRSSRIELVSATTRRGPVYPGGHPGRPGPFTVCWLPHCRGVTRPRVLPPTAGLHLQARKSGVPARMRTPVNGAGASQRAGHPSWPAHSAVVTRSSATVSAQLAAQLVPSLMSRFTSAIVAAARVMSRLAWLTWLAGPATVSRPPDQVRAYRARVWPSTAPDLLSVMFVISWSSGANPAHWAACPVAAGAGDDAAAGGEEGPRAAPALPHPARATAMAMAERATGTVFTGNHLRRDRRYGHLHRQPHCMRVQPDWALRRPIGQVILGTGGMQGVRNG